MKNDLSAKEIAVIINAPSARDVNKRLEALGLIELGPQRKGWFLTDEGEELGFYRDEAKLGYPLIVWKSDVLTVLGVPASDKPATLEDLENRLKRMEETILATHSMIRKMR